MDCGLLDLCIFLCFMWCVNYRGPSLWRQRRLIKHRIQKKKKRQKIKYHHTGKRLQHTNGNQVYGFSLVVHIKDLTKWTKVDFLYHRCSHTSHAVPPTVLLKSLIKTNVECTIQHPLLIWTWPTVPLINAIHQSSRYWHRSVWLGITVCTIRPVET